MYFRLFFFFIVAVASTTRGMHALICDCCMSSLAQSPCNPWNSPCHPWTNAHAIHGNAECCDPIERHPIERSGLEEADRACDDGRAFPESLCAVRPFAISGLRLRRGRVSRRLRRVLRSSRGLIVKPCMSRKSRTRRPGFCRGGQSRPLSSWYSFLLVSQVAAARRTYQGSLLSSCAGLFVGVLAVSSARTVRRIFAERREYVIIYAVT